MGRLSLGGMSHTPPPHAHTGGGEGWGGQEELGLMAGGMLVWDAASSHQLASRDAAPPSFKNMIHTTAQQHPNLPPRPCP